jgi:zinc and cadmium transporter
VIAALAGGVVSTLLAGFTLALGPGVDPAPRELRGRRAARRRVPRAPAACARSRQHPRGHGGDARGLLAFFLLEKLVLWRHSHGHEHHDEKLDESEHDHALHDQGRSGLMILIGNGVHNFCDGIVIAAAFLADTALGLAATVAIVAHALPQQVGDFAVLVHSGYARSRAFAVNVATGLATLAGALAAYFALSDMQQALPIVLALAASSLLYVAVADLIPSLHRRPEPLETAKQSLLIAAGIAVIAAVHALLQH